MDPLQPLRNKTTEYAHWAEHLFGKIFKNPLKFTSKRSIEAIVFLILFIGFFWFLAYRMTLPHMLNTFMQTAYHLLLETVFYIMAICVLMGAIGKLLVEFGVVRLLENILRPLMKPLYNLPGVAALGAIMTFLSDNPAIISLAQDKNFSRYFKKYQLVSLTNFGTAFGMGLMVLRELKKHFTKSRVTKMGSLLLSKQLLELKEEFDYTEYGGAPILGVQGAIIKMHGSADETAVEKSIIKAVPFVENNVVDIIRNATADLDRIKAEIDL